MNHLSLLVAEGFDGEIDGTFNAVEVIVEAGAGKHE